jgi:hypothetical protein
VAEGSTLAGALGADRRVGDALGPDELERLLDPAGAVGLAAELVDRVLAARHADQAG